MLELSNIVKDYYMEETVVNALKGVSITFRKSEFVSILGPSGCGKTTLLNIIGGLDNYTSGDLIINGKSTKDYSDKEWDTYRNHSVGFVFQSYNLIPHQTVLQNVELALTLSGVSKEERRKRAIEVLVKVGLKDKINSKPNQLSGGQMQRVAIARALVNDPEIILADEPTGALDSTTSTQIMEILKEIANDRLIIMVTHNPELANKYSSRIINLFDGELVQDSNSYTPENSKEVKEVHKGKKSMSFLTALSLSFKNLLTKKTRTLLVSFAGSIGIIGIALILALSSGFQGYINNVQKDTLSTYPISLNATAVDYSTMLGTLMDIGETTTNNPNGVENEKIYSNDIIVNMFKSILDGAKANDLKAFKAYLEENIADIEHYISAIQYTYDIQLNIYSNNQQLNPNSMFYDGAMVWLRGVAYKQVYARAEMMYRQSKGYDANVVLSETEILEIQASITEEQINIAMQSILAMIGSSSGSSGMGMSLDLASLKNNDLGLFTEMLDNIGLVKSQYDVVASLTEASSLFENLAYNEVVLTVDKNGNLSDYYLYALGIKTSPTIEDIAQGLINSKDYVIEPSSFNYSDVLGKTYKLLLDTDYYVQLEQNGAYVDIRTELEEGRITQDRYNELVSTLLNEKGVELKIKGIIKPKEGVSATSIKGAIGYTKELTSFMVGRVNSDVEAKNLVQELKIDLDVPASISFYCIDFDSKEEISKFITDYNLSVDESKQIAYTDYSAVMMSSVSTIINGITYVLIAFVSVSLIVSSIMIGIIIYISVLERTKEIGVLRAIGASKKDVKRVFTAESVIIGFSSGVLGIGITYLLTIPINIIIKSLAGLVNVAALPIAGAIILVTISVCLTFISGLIPARIASKKDPVTALRSE